VIATSSLPGARGGDLILRRSTQFIAGCLGHTCDIVLPFRTEYLGIVMAETAHVLHGWTDFYVIVGSSAGALTGLQFVVIALVAEARAARSMLEIRAFGSPTIVHFCVVLFVAAVVTAPWHALSRAAVCLSLCGAAGVVYTLRVIRHARMQTGYTPDREDWTWYMAFPLIAYVALLSSALALEWHPFGALFGVAAAVLALLFAGIHSAWDTVTYIAVNHSRKNGE
jgi:hypothetical protein